MARDTVRKITRDPAGDHVLVRRDSTGSVQTSQAVSTSTDPGTTGTGTTTVLTTTINDPPLVLNTEGTIAATGGGTGTTVNLIRNGTTTVTSLTNGTGSTTFGVNTHATPENSPTYALQVDANGATPTGVTMTLSREDRWA